MTLEELKKKKEALERSLQEKALMREIKSLEDKEKEEAAEEAPAPESEGDEDAPVETKTHAFGDLAEIQRIAQKSGGKADPKMLAALSEVVAKIDRMSRRGVSALDASKEVYIEKIVAKQFGAQASEVSAIAKDLAPALPILDLMSQATGKKLVNLATFKKWFPSITSEKFAKVIECVNLQNTENVLSKASMLQKNLNTGSGGGGAQEWIPIDLNSALEMYIQKSKAVAANLPFFDLPTNPYRWPIANSPNTTYFVTESQSADVTVSGTNVDPDEILWSAKKIANRQDFSEEMSEDAVFALTNVLVTLMGDSLGDGFERVCLFGDETITTANTNINRVGGPVVTTAGAADVFLAGDGLVKLARAANGVSKDVGSASSISAGMASVMADMGEGAAMPSDMLAFLNVATYFRALTDPNLITLDKFGSGATILTGQVGAIFGIPVFMTGGIPKTDSNGVIHDTTGNNTKGSYLLVKKSKVLGGYKRRMKVASDYRPITDKTHVVASMRFDIQQLVTNKPGINALGYGFNVTV